MIPLPVGLRSRQVDNGNGLSMSVLEAGFETADRPCVILLHGFPELPLQLAEGDAHTGTGGLLVIAADQRGYGETLGSETDYELTCVFLECLILCVMYWDLYGRWILAGCCGRRSRFWFTGCCILCFATPRCILFGRDDERTVCWSTQCLQEL
ncbi:MAG: hypothetical protein CM1200mP18_22420 [Gammaproteobacteria bacterium]|nr:MAG: hypothetical protein CM1200mP18_22420 [Gammaproteobacteria bacterium]